MIEETEKKVLNEFTKYDKNKVDLSLMEPGIEVSYCRIAEFGAKKYSRGNWKKAKLEDVPRYYAAMKRHENAELQGEYLDVESGEPHGDHALWGRGAVNFFVRKFGYEIVFNLIRGIETPKVLEISVDKEIGNNS